MACFEMLVERLNVIERRCDDSQKIARDEQRHKKGFLNVAALGWKTEVFVHEPIDNLRDPFEQSYGFYLRTNIKSPRELEKIILHKMLDREFDEVLNSCNADIETIRYRFQRELDMFDEEDGAGEYLRCHEVGLKSDRVFVIDHMKDILAQNWARVRARGNWTKIMFDTEYTFTLWMVPSQEKHKDIPSCCEAMFDIFDSMRLERPANVQICGLTEREFDFLWRLEVLLSYNGWKLGRDELPSRQQEWHDLQVEAMKHNEWVDKIDRHPLWKGCQRWLV